MTLEHHLHLYVDNVQEDERFSCLKDIGTLSRLMVEIGKHLTFPLVFRLLKLALTLPVVTATIERCVSSIKIVKTNLRNRMTYSYLSDSLISYNEKNIFVPICNDVIVCFMKLNNYNILI